MAPQAIEGVYFLPDDARFPNKKKAAKGEKRKDRGYVLTAGDKGQLRVWDLATKECVAEEQLNAPRIAITRLMYAAAKTIVSLAFFVILT